MEKEIYLTSSVCIEDIIFSINQLPHEEITDFILRLDIAVADYGFTDNLIGKLKKALDAEQE